MTPARPSLPLARHSSVPGESAGAVKAGEAAERSEGSLYGPEHSSMISSRRAGAFTRQKRTLNNPIPAAFSVLTAGGHYRSSGTLLRPRSKRVAGMCIDETTNIWDESGADGIT
jgi:hypothetical protein